MDIVGGLRETSQHESEPSGPQAPGDDGQRCGETPRQGKEASGVGFDRASLSHALAKLILCNESNFCYLNASIVALLWASICRHDFKLEHWGQAALLIAETIISNSNPISLRLQQWLHPVLHDWGMDGDQGDPAEFISMVLQGLKFPDIDMTWERRVLHHDAVCCADKGAQWQPLVLQFPGDLFATLPIPQMTLQNLIHAWHHHHGMITAMLRMSPLLCLQVDRYIQQDDGTVR